jgi:hypothetical protein
MFEPRCVFSLDARFQNWKRTGQSGRSFATTAEWA